MKEPGRRPRVVRGRPGVLAGTDGALMVDSQYLQIGDRVLAAVRRIDPGPIRFLQAQRGRAPIGLSPCCISQLKGGR